MADQSEEHPVAASLRALGLGKPSPPPPPPRPPGPPRARPAGGDEPNDRRYALAALDDECAIVAGTTEGSRNQQLNKSMYKMGRFINDRLLTEDEVKNALREAALEAGLDPHEIEPTLRSGQRGAQAKGLRAEIPERPPIDPAYTVDFEAPEASGGDDFEPPASVDDWDIQPPLEEIEDGFWDRRPSLQLIYQAALSQMASPWAVLACCTARLLARVPPDVTLPAIIGGPGSLNWYSAISAKSGGGKGAAMAVASGLVRDDELLIRGVGSGEGMLEVYNRGKKYKDDDAMADDPPVVSVLFSIDEIDSLRAMNGRSGQTTMSIIRQGFSGENLGFSYRGRHGEVVAAHSYRLTIIASVQPERAGVLFEDSGGGTPQRFMWFPARDKRITADPPAWPEDEFGRLSLPVPTPGDLAGIGVVEVPEKAVRTIREARAASMSGDDNALDSHALYCREKFAFALALMDQRTFITDEDWDLSGIALEVSDWCRAKANDGYKKGLEAESRSRGEMKGHENDARSVTEYMAYQKDVARILRWMVNTLNRYGYMTLAELSRRASGRDKPRLKAAVDLGMYQKDLIYVNGRIAAR